MSQQIIPERGKQTDAEITAWIKQHPRNPEYQRMIEVPPSGEVPNYIGDMIIETAQDEFLTMLRTEHIAAQVFGTATQTAKQYKAGIGKSFEIAQDMEQPVYWNGPQPHDGEKIDSSSYQEQVNRWMLACFPHDVSKDTIERNHRFMEEALELVQSLSCTKQEVLQLTDYVFARPIGEPFNEVGGVMVTLAALCNSAMVELELAATEELAKVWTKIDKIRAKWESKPKASPLPQTVEAVGTLYTRDQVIALFHKFNAYGDYCAPSYLEAWIETNLPITK